MPQGTCKDFRNKISNLLNRLKEDLARAFSSDEYKNSHKKIIEESQAEQQKILQEIGEDTRKQGFLLEMTQMGPVLVPLIDGRPMDQATYMGLDESVRKDLDKRHAELLKSVQRTFEKLHELQHQTVQKLADADKALADITVTRLFDVPLTDYKDQPKIIQYLNNLKQYTLDNLDIFKGMRERRRPFSACPAARSCKAVTRIFLSRSTCSLITVKPQGPPVITEPNPIYPNLFGKVERRFLFGGYLSDHTMLKPGAIHRANGGYLLLSAAEVIMNLGVWPALKRAIRTKEVGVEDPFEQFGLFAPQGMKPEPIPIEIKIFLIGDPFIYQLLAMYDEEFWELFRVKADFDYEVQRTQG